MDNSTALTLGMVIIGLVIILSIIKFSKKDDGSWRPVNGPPRIPRSNIACNRCGSYLEMVEFGNAYLLNGMQCAVCKKIICGDCEKALGKPEACPWCGGTLKTIVLSK